MRIINEEGAQASFETGAPVPHLSRKSQRRERAISVRIVVLREKRHLVGVQVVIEAGSARLKSAGGHKCGARGGQMVAPSLSLHRSPHGNTTLRFAQSPSSLSFSIF